MTTELKQLREALRRVKYEAVSLADAQVIALEALTAAQPAQAGEVDERVAFEAFAAKNDFGSYLIERKGDGYWSSHTQLMWMAWDARASLPTQPAAQATPDVPEVCFGNKATPEPVGEVLQFPPMPEGWPARFRCDSCDGNGEIGELVSMGHFQPPERQTCPDCGGRGWASEEHAFNADHMREFAEAHALLTRPAPGVPDGFALVGIEALEAWGKLDEVKAACVYPYTAQAK